MLHTLSRRSSRSNGGASEDGGATGFSRQNRRELRLNCVEFSINFTPLVVEITRGHQILHGVSIRKFTVPHRATLVFNIFRFKAFHQLYIRLLAILLSLLKSKPHSTMWDVHRCIKYLWPSTLVASCAQNNPGLACLIIFLCASSLHITLYIHGKSIRAAAVAAIYRGP